MEQRGLLQKNKLQVIIILILCIQLLGYNELLDITTVKAVEFDSLEPKVSITNPVTETLFNQEYLTISGTVENFGTDVSIVLYNGSKEIGSTNRVVNGTWSNMVLFTEGTYSFYAIATDSEGKTATSTNININLDITPPEITFLAPTEGTYLNSGKVEGTTEPYSTVQLCLECKKDNEGQVIGNWVTVTADIIGKWIYVDPQLADGSHLVYAKATDRAGNVGSNKSVTFILDKSRPIVLPNVFPKQDMTQVSLDSLIKIKISDKTSINEQAITNSIILSNNGKNVPGELEYNPDTKELTFTPDTPLIPGKKYNVFISPLGLIDSAGNLAFPKFWSFTTASVLSKQHENPHGSYASNVNTCMNCHSTHIASNPNLLEQKNLNDPVEIGSFTVDNYCMACHDGTVVPMPENMQSAHKHDAAIRSDGTPSGSACASCHNPHLEWSEENPNLTQDHVVYKHKTPNEEVPISSKEQLCESCHENDSADKIANEDVEYRLFKYNKWSNAVGIRDDYDLCLRCHNGDFRKKYDKTSDIASYYNYLTEEVVEQYKLANSTTSFFEREISEAEKNFSGHIIKAQDGSSLAGYIPCAECHDAHGSNNIKQLKTQIGHENPKTFNATTGEWDAVKERNFCITCHNGETAIYGVVGKAIYDTNTGAAIDPTKTGHNKTSTEACSTCHSDNNSFLEAAHAPKR